MQTRLSARQVVVDYREVLVPQTNAAGEETRLPFQVERFATGQHVLRIETAGETED